MEKLPLVFKRINSPIKAANKVKASFLMFEKKDAFYISINHEIPLCFFITFSGKSVIQPITHSWGF